MAHADDSSGDTVAPAEAFSVVASETRLEILEALWRAEGPVAFSTLFEAVPLSDSGQFNYHLQQLTDQFVVDDDEGYRLRRAGAQVIRALRAGTFTRAPDLDPFPVEGACTRCGGGLRAHYTDEAFAVRCADCGKAHGEYPFPPGGLADRDDGEVAQAFAERVRHLHCLAADGVCPACAGRMETTITRDGDCCLDVSVRAEFRCARCRHELCSPVGLSLLDNSAVAAFYEEHGVDLASRPYWTLPWCVDDEYATVESTDPWRVEVRVPVADEALHVTLDGDLTVLDTERRACGH